MFFSRFFLKTDFQLTLYTHFMKKYMFVTELGVLYLKYLKSVSEWKVVSSLEYLQSTDYRLV
jgi:hypothetical protein